MSERGVLYRVVVPHFTAGIVADDNEGKIVEAAPICRWMIGKPIQVARSWADRKGGTVVRIGSVSGGEGR